MIAGIVTGIAIGLLSVIVMLLMICGVFWFIAILPDREETLMDEKRRQQAERWKGDGQ